MGLIDAIGLIIGVVLCVTIGGFLALLNELGKFCRDIFPYGKDEETEGDGKHRRKRRSRKKSIYEIHRRRYDAGGRSRSDRQRRG